MEKLRELGETLREKLPRFLTTNTHFNFITLHYIWIISWVIIGSILIYGPSTATTWNLKYVDALFTASGACTQAGLNTVDNNLFNTFQQIVLYFLSMLTCPITIHSTVVFARLYWFEKRFQHVVKEARQRRTTISKTISLSRSKAKPADDDDAEKGINGRHITVMHDTVKTNQLHNDGSLLSDDDTTRKEAGSSSSSNEAPVRQSTPQIKFVDPVKRSDKPSNNDDEEDEDIPLPGKRTEAEHIAILERQRKDDKSVLRIPGPRDVERGLRPEELDEDIDHLRSPTGHRRQSSTAAVRPRLTQTVSHPDRHPTITIAEPPRPNRDGPDATQDKADTTGNIHFQSTPSQDARLKRTDTANSAGTTFANPLQRIRTAITARDEQPDMPYLSWEPTVGRNSTFWGLTEEQREELGGIEYRSLKTLAVVLGVYFWGYTIFGAISLVPWILINSGKWGKVVDQAGINRTWWAFFTANSAFMDHGATLTPDSMISFDDAIWPLLLMSFLIIIGNTGFPIMLRFMIWVTSKFAPRGSGLWEELRFLLDHPRRCFTLLFPSNATWWLFFIVIALNGLDIILFVVLDLNASAVEQLPVNIRFLVGWFNATCTRTAGFSAVNLSLLHPAIQTSYLIMMYISVFPIAISVRRTNVYEETSLGVVNDNSNDEDDSKQGSLTYVGTHLRRQLSFDLWYVFLAFFIMNITEGSRLMAGDFTQFGVLFEIVSAYGTVGLSMGYSTVDASLSSQFSTVGKLVIVALQIRGRHRGLPYGLDRAVLLPSERLNRAEEDELALGPRNSSTTLERHVSLSRGRTHSIDRRGMLSGFLVPGPSFNPHSIHKSDFPENTGRSETLARTTSVSGPEGVDENGLSEIRPRPTRTETQPIMTAPSLAR